MFTSIYLYRVPKAQVDAFLQIQREAAQIYRSYGALDDVTFVASNLEAKYGCLAFDETFPVGADEVVLISLSSFLDRFHHDEVMSKVDVDERIDELYQQVTTLLDIGRVIRGEFEQVV
ncbi:DUF1428 family protein [Ktedonosporobacter rubrisoli]|uniref:DUF1428 family protein n=1 Tax=Ktedonosporobacter rubrisoli TaxID=2509675 RepID=A0A4V0YYT6_KTERU|nr:DUF1428 family protein [Ktedonosporobacter rubrisoli]QBD77351.1 DUF1428 family protein [Ktedonosporobacter rubrisoli]